MWENKPLSRSSSWWEQQDWMKNRQLFLVFWSMSPGHMELTWSQRPVMSRIIQGMPPSHEDIFITYKVNYVRYTCQQCCNSIYQSPAHKYKLSSELFLLQWNLIWCLVSRIVTVTRVSLLRHKTCWSSEMPMLTDVPAPPPTQAVWDPGAPNYHNRLQK